MAKADLVSAGEVADRLGVRKQTVHMWQHRGLFPAPDWRLASGPVWRWATVAKWARSTGRL